MGKHLYTIKNIVLYTKTQRGVKRKMTERIVQKLYEMNIQLALIEEQLEKLNKNIEKQTNEVQE